MVRPVPCEYCGVIRRYHDDEACGWAATFLPGEAFRDLEDTLPYSTIPSTRDAAEVVAWFLNRGWRPPGGLDGNSA